MHTHEDLLSAHVGPVEAALAEYFLRRDRGENVDLAELVARFPGCEDDVRRFMEQERKVQGAMADTPRDIAESQDLPGQRLGDFRVLRELGHGGMGIVYEAEQISLGRRVALKVLPSAALGGKQQLARFKNEARAAATLDHPHIVAVYWVGSEGRVHYYAMQLIDGPSLAQVIAGLRRRELPDLPAGEESLAEAVLSTENGQVSTDFVSPEAPSAAATRDGAVDATRGDNPESHLAFRSALPTFKSAEFYCAVARLGVQAAQALDHAHENGILHRDIKPGNLMCDSAGKLYVTDFGLARIETDVRLTMTGDLIGTLRYMAPEQALAKRAVVDHRSDIYSLGATLYEMLTLHPAFAGEDRQELLRQIAFDEPRRPRQIDARIPRDLETIVLKAMEKEPSERYAMAQELANDLLRFLANEPIQAMPPRIVQCLTKWSRRHVAAVWAAAFASIAVAAVLLISTFVVSHWYREANIQRVTAAKQAGRAESALASTEKARREADLQREQAEVVTNFVITSLKAHDPNNGGKQGLTVAEAMTQIMQELDQGALADQPARVAYLLEHVSMILDGNGKTPEAERAAEQSLRIRQQLYGEDHEATVRSLNNLAGFRMHLGHLSEAEPLFERVLEFYQRQSPDENSQYLAWAMNNLAGVRDKLGRTEEAAPLFEEALKLEQQRLVNEDDPSIVRAKLNLAGVRQRLGQSDIAEQLYGEALAMSKRLYSEDDPLVAHCLNSLAALHQDRGQLDRSEPLWEEALRMRQRLFQGDHPAVASSLNNLAWARRDRGQLTEAEELYTAALEMYRRLYKGDHPDIVRCLTNLAQVRKDRGQLSEAEGMLVEAVEMGRRTLPAKHEYVQIATELLAEVRESRDKSEGKPSSVD